MAADQPDHDQLRESVGLYVLGALDAVERAAFERHLQSCDECAAEVRSLNGVATALPFAVPMVDPAPSLRTRVLAVTGPRAATPSTVVAMPTRVKPRSPSVSAGWLSAAALLLVAIGLTGYSASLRRQIGGLQAEVRDLSVRVDRSEERVAVATRQVGAAEARMAVLTAPDMTQVDLQGQPVSPQASGRAFWSRSRGLVFTASNLPPLPAGRAYQLWVVTLQAPVSAGLLQPDASGRVAQAFDTALDLPNAVAIAVTQEPEGGVPAPTGDKYLVGLTH